MSEKESNSSQSEDSFSNLSISILLIDGKGDGRILLAKLLKQCSLDTSVVLAASMEEAKLQFLHTCFDIVFIHYQRVNDGDELTGLEHNQGFGAQKLVLMVDEFSHDLARLALKIHAFDLIRFPPTVDDFTAILHRCIEAPSLAKDDKSKGTGIKQLKLTEQGVPFKIANGYFYAEPVNILFGKAFKHYCILVMATTGEEVIVHESINAVDQKVKNTPLLRTDRCHLINIQAIIRINKRNHLVFLRGNGFTKEIEISGKGIELLKRILCLMMNSKNENNLT